MGLHEILIGAKNVTGRCQWFEGVRKWTKKFMGLVVKSYVYFSDIKVQWLCTSKT